MFKRFLGLLPKGVQERWRQTFNSLNNSNFRLYSIGQVVSVCGTFMQNVAVSWIVYKLTGSATALGLVTFAGNLPLLLLTYFGGIAADRYDRRKMLIITQWLDMMESITICFLAISGILNVTWLVVLAIYTGCITAFETPTRQSFVPEMVDEGELGNAISLNSAIFNSARMFGPVLAGFVLASFGADAHWLDNLLSWAGFHNAAAWSETRGIAVCFGLDALSYLAALYTLYKLKTKRRVPPRQRGDATAGGAIDMKSMLREPRLLNVIMLVAATSLFGFQYAVLLPIIVKEVLHGEAAMLAFISAAGGVGALTGSLILAGGKTRSKTLNRYIGFAALGLAGAIALLGSATTTWMALLAVAGCGFCISSQLSGANTLLQSGVPAAARGRLMGIYSMCLLGFAPFAALFAGWFTDKAGVHTALYVSAGMLVISAVAYLLRTPRALSNFNGEE
jgi:MFS family permease